MDVDAGLLAQEREIVGELGVVLAAADSIGHLLVESLDSDFELQSGGGELLDQLAQRLGEAVGDHLKVQEEARPVPVEEELEDGFGGIQIQIEGAVHELEAIEAAVEELLHLSKERIERNVADGDIERGETEFTFERAAARGLDVDDAMGEIVVGVEGVGEMNSAED